MRLIYLAVLTACAGTLLGCDGAVAPTASGDGEPAILLAQSGGATAHVTGSGHLTRTIGEETGLTTFSYSAIRHADGRTSGQFQYNFRVLGFVMHGSVTCVSVNGNQGWIGGVVDKVTSDIDPFWLQFLDTEIWWRVVDNGDGGNGTPDLTSALLFTLPGGTITAESWCRDQNVAGLLRPIEHGNIQVRD